jgi:hypothetical protein
LYFENLSENPPKNPYRQELIRSILDIPHVALFGAYAQRVGGREAGKNVNPVIKIVL